MQFSWSSLFKSCVESVFCGFVAFLCSDIREHISGFDEYVKVCPYEKHLNYMERVIVGMRKKTKQASKINLGRLIFSKDPDVSELLTTNNLKAITQLLTTFFKKKKFL